MSPAAVSALYRLFSGMQATARTYEETLEEAVETVEEKLLSDQATQRTGGGQGSRGAEARADAGLGR